MEITFLGHAGFLIETEKTILVMDAWVSKTGAFDGGWFQYPQNHHMAKFITNIINKHAEKDTYIYVSHEHKDHFDVPFLKSIEHLDFKYIIPKFRRTLLADGIKSFSKKEMLVCEDGDQLKFNEDEYVKIYSDDSELNRDSAILFTSKSKKFLNLNDCKIYDRLELIRKEEGEINAFAMQFSGATWHPTCYEYTNSEYARISKKKKRNKFEATARCIEAIKPEVYIPSAGPACFLDPDIIHLNFQDHNIFPRSQELISHLDIRLSVVKPLIQSMSPEDKIIVSDDITFKKGSLDAVTEEGFKEYILEYAKGYEAFFADIKQPILGDKYIALKEYILKEFQDKLDNFKSKNQIPRPLYFEFIDHSDDIFRIDFEKGEVKEASEIIETDYYRFKANSYDIQRIKEGFITWEDYALTFRMKLNREPDVYQVLMQGFLILEKEDLNFFCDKLLEIENRSERITIESGGCKYRIDRYCPHQGADLKYAIIEGNTVICPRHHWAFNIEDEGKCRINSSTINAFPLEED